MRGLCTNLRVGQEAILDRRSGCHVAEEDAPVVSNNSIEASHPVVSRAPGGTGRDVVHAARA